MLKRLASLLLCFALAAGTALAGTPSGDAVPDASTGLRPDLGHRIVEQYAALRLVRGHYSHPDLNDALSSRILDRYIRQLDPNRLYLLASDVAGFEKYRDKLDDAIKAGNLDPAFSIYRVYRERLEQRIDYALKVLDSKPDFTRKEQFIFDRENQPWATSTDELDDIWRKRIKNDAIGLMLTGKNWDDAAKVLRERYENFQRRAHQIKVEDVFDTYMNAFTQTLDPHTTYFSPRDSEEFQIRMSLSLEGIGAALQMQDEYVTVMRVIAGGPADKSGKLHPKDRITAVGQGEHGKMVDVIGWRLDDVVQMIRGKKGSQVRLRILPAGAVPGSPEKTLQLTRNKIELAEQAAQKKLLTVTDSGKKYRIGVINVPAFYLDYRAKQAGEPDYRSTTRDVHKLIDELKKEHMDALLLDLRDNGGGSLQEAQELTGLFINQGPVVQLRDSEGDVQVLRDDDAGVAWDGPMAVMVNRNSASASEIFAGAIQDYHRGLIIGSTTYGKGTVQTLLPLSRALPDNKDAGELKMTIGKFYRVSGASTQVRGVTPDVSLPEVIDPGQIGEDTDKSALPWDTIAPAKYQPAQALTAVIPKLIARHQARVSGEDAYQDFVQEVNDLHAEQARKSVSLVLAERKAEQDKENGDRLARENARRKARGEAPLKSLDDLKSDDKDTDVLLTEGATILSDYVLLSGKDSDKASLAETAH